MSFPSVLEKYRSQAVNKMALGESFERLIQAYLKTDPQYAGLFEKVWMWEEFPHRSHIGEGDVGIDIVCLTHEGDYWAVQCKCYQPTTVIDKAAVDTFLATSSRKFYDRQQIQRRFSQRLWVSTSDRWGTNAEQALLNQEPSVARINQYDLEQAPIDWEKLDEGITGDLARTTRKQPRDHQKLAISKTLAGFELHDRGKLIMACGTGKTFTSLRIAQDLTNHEGFVLFLIPSIALLGQSLREWTSDAEHSLHPIAVCSDARITKNYSKNDDIDLFKVYDLGYPASTDVDDVARQMRLGLRRKDKGLTVIFSTYQSIEVIIAAQAKLRGELSDEHFGEFDLVICDEAHRTTGVTLEGEEGSSFTQVHNQTRLRAKKRLYMTATPRLYDDSSKQKAEEDNALLCSMDDTELYGEEFYRIGFGEAVERGLLSDYKVLILTLNEGNIPLGIQNMISSNEHEINTDDASKLIGCINALSKKVLGDEGSLSKTDPAPMKKAVAFCAKITDSKKITHAFNDAGGVYLNEVDDDYAQDLVEVKSRHIDGAMNAPERSELMSWLKSTSGEENECRVLTNVRCLSEGVDVPSLDAVMFLSPRNSQVDVVQSVGRVMRKAEGKRYGYIIIPVVIPSFVDPAKALEDNDRFKVVWTVLNALRAHDDRFNATVNKIELNKRKPDNILVGAPEGHFEENVFQTADPKGGYGKDLSKQLSFHFEELQSAVYARLVKKVGDRVYWEQWAASVAEIAQSHIARISKLVNDGDRHAAAFENFLRGLHQNINPSVTKDEAIEMLSQHLITKPVFDALFDGYSFVEKNPVSLAMQQMIDLLEDQALEKDTRDLEKFYDSVRRRAEGIDNAEGKQRIIIELYDKFFQTAFPKLVERLGIVYTPVEVVDYIIHSVDDLLKQEFGKSLSSEGVHVLDPFTGTGTFITRIIQSGLISKEDLERKFKHELHSNEIVLLAYYIAAINAESAYHELIGEEGYTPFDGICLTDTFQLGEADGTNTLYTDMFPKNSVRVEAQKKAKIQVIVGNPPYSIGQSAANDNAQNQSYPLLEQKIEATYAEISSAGLKKGLYDSYIKAFKWSSERLDPEKGGIIGFVTNGSWIDGNAQDGMRKCLAEEFTSIYVFNLRGNQRTSGEKSRQEGGKIFGSGSRTPVSICFLIKNPKVKVDVATIYYRDIGDYMTREEKLTIVSSAGSLLSKEMKWKVIKPNKAGDWINQRSQVFETMIPLGDKKGKSEKTAFKPIYSLGIASGRDPWCYNSSTKELTINVRKTFEFFNSESARIREQVGAGDTDLRNLVSLDSSLISWNDQFISHLRSGREKEFDITTVRTSMYRPFFKQSLYYSPEMIMRPGLSGSIFPERDTENRVIAISGTGGSKPFSCLMVDRVMCLDAVEKSQCFPLWYWEEERVDDLFATSGKQCGLTDWFVGEGRKRFGQDVTPEDLFYYIYGLLHTKSYRETFESDVKKVLARVTLDVSKEQYEALRDAGRKLGDWHVNYESVPPHPQVVVYGDEWGDFNVKKMRQKKGELEKITYNGKITLSNIPEKAYQYEVNGRSAIGWILDRYQVKTDKKSGIVNDPNDWAEEVGNPRYILDLLLSVIHVSTKTVDIVDGLPEIEF